MTQPITITLELSHDEFILLEEIAQERGLNEPSQAIHWILKDITTLYDQLWDKKFAMSQALLSQLAEEGHAEYVAGLTEDLDIDDFKL